LSRPLPICRIGSEIPLGVCFGLNTFNIRRHLVTSATKRRFRTEAFETSRAAVAVAARTTFFCNPNWT